MSKSLGNFFTLRDLIAKGFVGREIRYLLLTAHYREQFNFTLEGLQGARTALARLDGCVLRLREVAGKASAEADPQILEKVTTVLDDDLNISAAWGAIFEWVASLNRLLSGNAISAEQAAGAVAAWDRLDAILGLRIGRQKVVTAGEVQVVGSDADAVPPEMAALLEQRQAARKAKDFKQSDAIREQLKSQGWAIEDTPKGARLKRL